MGQIIDGQYYTDDELSGRDSGESSGPPYDYAPENPTGAGLEPPNSSWDPDTGTWTTTPPPPSGVDSGSATPDASVSGIPQDWLTDFLSRNPGDIGRAQSAYTSNNMQSRPFDSQSAYYDQATNTLTPAGQALAARRGTTGQPPPFDLQAQFTDPISRFIEQFAQQRAQDLENPPWQSGQRRLEDLLRQQSATFAGQGTTNQQAFERALGDVSSQFREALSPGQRLLEDILQRQTAQAERGTANQQLFEDALRKASAQFEQGSPGQRAFEDASKRVSAEFANGGFTPAELEIFQTQALDPLERLRSSRKQQVMQTLSARGIDPQSGVALQMLADVDRQFDQLRTTQQRDIAGQAAEERRARMIEAVNLLSGVAGAERGRAVEGVNLLGQLAGTEGQRLSQATTLAERLAGTQGERALQAVNLLGGRAGSEQQRQGQAVNLAGALAGTERQRRDEAFQYRTVPLNLADRAFNQATQVQNMTSNEGSRLFNEALQTYTTSGNPMALVQPLMALAKAEGGRNRGLADMLGYLAEILNRG